MNSRKILFTFLFTTLFSSQTFSQTALSTLYDHHVTITIDPSMVSGSSDISNFPLLISMENVDDLREDPSGFILDAGSDIVFAPSPASTDNDYYKHYLESYEGSTGTLIIWVQVDLSATINTEIEMFYGRPSGSPSSTSEVWTDANFLGTWQLSEDPEIEGIIDATGNSANGTAFNMTHSSNVVSSIVGQGYSFNGVDEYISIPDNSIIEPTGSFSISCWFQTSGTQNPWAKMFAKGRTIAPYATYTLEMRLNGGNYDDEIGFQTARNNGNYVTTSSIANGIDDINTGEWNYFVGVIEKNGSNYTQYTYLNGEEISSSTLESTSSIAYYNPTDYSLTIGGLNDGGLNNAFTGIIDELRIAGVARSEDYIKTELRNTACVSNYMTIESLGGLSCTDSSLPVDFDFIDAKRTNDQVLITWSTASEENNDYFSIEKSLDNLHFEEIGTRLGAGNSNELLEYSFTDYNSPSGLIYYRIKQTDYDGSYDYSKIVKVTGEFQNGSTLSIYPNPSIAGSSINLTISDIESESVELSISNLSGGQVFFDRIETLSEKHFIHSLDTRNILPGTYLLSLVSDKKAFTEKIIIQ